MKAKRKETRKAAEAVAPKRSRKLWPWTVGLLAAVYAVFQVYAPVMRGPFLFDDDYLPFRVPGFSDNLRIWVAGVRPLLMLTYWANFRVSGLDTFSYHLVNVSLHFGGGVLAFLVLRRFLAMAGENAPRGLMFAVFGAGVFLLHPVQTESVSYVASRSESLSGFFMLASYAVVVCRRAEVVNWCTAAAALVLFAAALASKEHTLVLPVLFLLTDYYWNPGFSVQGIRRNWRLYAPLAAGVLPGIWLVMGVLRAAKTAGFGVQGITWYQYLFTECRAIFVYLRLFLLPYGQTADYDFAVSRTVLDHGAIVGLVALAAISVAAWIWRRRYPLASFGWFAFLVLMAPTSSFVPIKDVIAERRLYLPIVALLLIALDFLRRLKAPRPALAAALGVILVVFGGLTYARNLVWSDRIALWEDTATKSPGNARAHFQLAYAYFENGRCSEAERHYRRAAELQGATYDLLVDWALAYDCLNEPVKALEKLRQAAKLEPGAHVYSLVGMVYAKQARWDDALNALATAERLNPGYAMTFVYRGGVKLAQNDLAGAVAEYRRALALEPDNTVARQGLAQAEDRLRKL